MRRRGQHTPSNQLEVEANSGLPEPPPNSTFPTGFDSCVDDAHLSI